MGRLISAASTLELGLPGENLIRRLWAHLFIVRDLLANLEDIRFQSALVYCGTK